ncbi:hypothetical protein ABTX81_06545 [Kitasatospora sp. NPDC097605]|uniref:DUF7617 domain-containing protein n=1 Tax=Kitasatospora sp. NPDC097605 TaxID=3157226 RepID=UPI00332F6EF7
MTRCPPTPPYRGPSPDGWFARRPPGRAVGLLAAFAAAVASLTVPTLALGHGESRAATVADRAATAHPADRQGTARAGGPGGRQDGRQGRQLPVTLSKTGTDLTTGSTTTTTQGDTVRWVVSMTNPENAPVSTTITDVIQGGPGSTPQTQTYVPGSLQAPPGFTKQWSTDGGTTFAPADAGTATNAVQATNPELSSPATGRVVPIPPPFKPINTATGGDGFTPILYTATINGVPTPEAWNIYHHGFASPASVVCTDLLSNGPCPTPTGAPASWPQALNSSVPNGNIGDLGSTRSPTYVQSGSKLYYAAVSRVTPRLIGIGCIDLQAQASCGFTPLQEGTGTVIGGVVEVPGGFDYTVSGTGEILCYDRAANAPCGTFNIGLPENEGQGGFPGDYVGTMTVINGKVYVTDTQRNPLGSVMGCFDPSTNTACTGWATPKLLVVPTTSGPTRADNVFAIYDSAGTATGVCTIVGGNYLEVNPPIGTPVCFDLAGNPIAAPPGLQALVSTNVAPGEANYQVPLTITAPNGHLETEFPFWLYQGNTPTLNSSLFCYDWTIQGPCVQYGTNGVVNGPPNVNGGNTSPYGFAYDGQCKYSLGDTGFLFSLDPVTGASPCLKTKAQSTVNPAAFYCDAATGHVTSYGTVSLFGIDPTTVDFTQSTVTVLAADNTPLGTFPFNPATGTADISSVPITNAPIQVIGNLDLISDASFTPGNQPQMQVTFVGDAPQICFDTTVGTDCSITSVSNQASAVTNGGAPVTSNTVTLQVTPGPTCAPSLSIDKEVCTSANAADCATGGPGPWAKTAVIAPGATAYWRITVTNTGQVPVTGITLTDSVSPSCVTAAGTFDLAVGASHQVFCDLTNVTQRTVNTVTASFPGPGGTPITTPPSEATVDVPALAVLKEVCTSANAADCVDGGPGPWAASTTVVSGSTAYWRITVTNTGTVPITGITLTDSVSPSCVTAAGTFDLAAGASHQVFCDLMNITQHTVNTVTASFPGPGGTPITTPPSEATVDVPGLTINKEVCTSANAADCATGGPGPWAKNAVVAPGATAYWRITVTNTGTVPITGITLTDSVSPSCVTAAGTFDLAAGASHQVFCDLTNVTQHTVNTVTASFPGPGGTPITTPPSEATVDVPGLTINKEVCTSANAADCATGGPGPWAKNAVVAPGATAYWRITVTNTGTVPITGITLTDSVSPSCVTAAGTFDLAAGASHQVFCDLTNVTQHTVNTVTASFPGPGGTPITTPPSEATVDVTPPPVPSLSINKEVCTSANAADCATGGPGPWAKNAVLAPGATAYWRITVTNTGEVPVTGITLTDSVSPSCVTAAGTFDLAAGASHQVFCDLANITQHTVNTVTASFPGPGGTPITTPPSEAAVDVPSLTVLKEVCTSANAADCAGGGPGPWAASTTIPSGNTAHWRITVTNNGTIPVSGITLTDSVSPSCVTAAGTFDLAVGASRQIFCDLANVTQRTVNTVTASFPGPGGTPITTPPSEATVEVTPPVVPSLSINKEVCTSANAADCAAGGPGPWAKTSTVTSGTTAHWRITVTNTGTVPTTGITLTDSVSPSCVTAAGTFDLAAGASRQIFCDLANVTQRTVNTVTASFPGPGGTPITTPPSEATVEVTRPGTPSLDINKEVCQSDKPGDCGAGGSGPWGKEVTLHKGGSSEEPCDPDKCQAFWRITVTNTGTTDITGITLDDPQEAACVAAAGTFNLAAGQSRTFHCSSLIGKDTTNTVTASFTGPDGKTVTTPPSSAVARCTPPCKKDKCHEPKPPHEGGHENGNGQGNDNGYGHGHGNGYGSGPGNNGGDGHQQPSQQPNQQPGPQHSSQHHPGHSGGGLPDTGSTVLPYSLAGAALAALGLALTMVARARRRRSDRMDG